jgi:lycopene beta-cyclase
MIPNKKSTIYDFVFIGLGASNSLILLALEENGLIQNKKIAVFEPDTKSNNDKTYCFWAHPEDSIVITLKSIISRSFKSIRINETIEENIENCPYHYIRSIDLYEHTRKIVNAANMDIYPINVEEITVDGTLNELHTEEGIYYAQYIFDSRPPALNTIPNNEIHLHQSFLGWHVKCEKAVFQTDRFDMMNFNIDQNEFTQFMYVIPFSAHEALVEFTRFGSERIELTYANKVLEDYITREFGEFEKLNQEVGCIPMTTFTFPPSQNEGILNTGARANLIKPSTGYGFKFMFEFAKVVSQRMANNDLQHFNEISLQTKSRFKFYDRLLLLILLLCPKDGKRIFTSLFYKRSVPSIFQFLDEKTNLFDEIKIFMFI